MDRLLCILINKASITKRLSRGNNWTLSFIKHTASIQYGNGCLGWLGIFRSFAGAHWQGKAIAIYDGTHLLSSDSISFRTQSMLSEFANVYAVTLSFFPPLATNDCIYYNHEFVCKHPTGLFRDCVCVPLCVFPVLTLCDNHPNRQNSIFIVDICLIPIKSFAVYPLPPPSLWPFL